MSFVAINVAVRLQGSELDQEEAGRWFSSGPSGHVRNTTRLWLAAWGKVATQTFIEQKLLLSLSLPLYFSLCLCVYLSVSEFVSLTLCLSLCFCVFSLPLFYLSVCVLVSLSVCLSLCLFVSPGLWLQSPYAVFSGFLYIVCSTSH